MICSEEMGSCACNSTGMVFLSFL